MFELEQIRLSLSAYDEKLEEMGASLWRRWRKGENNRIRRNIRWPRLLGRYGKKSKSIKTVKRIKK